MLRCNLCQSPSNLYYCAGTREYLCESCMFTRAEEALYRIRGADDLIVIAPSIVIIAGDLE
jgi:transposase-like protein